MNLTKLGIARWFQNRMKTILEHNGFDSNLETASITVAECEPKDLWTPCDLIAREYLNNGGGSAKGFLGIGCRECERCYEYMCDIKDILIENDLISKEAWNNSGFGLWSNYNFDFARSPRV